VDADHLPALALGEGSAVVLLALDAEGVVVVIGADLA
jgi:hypothetical protein